VVEAAVIAVPNEKWGEVGQAVVVLSSLSLSKAGLRQAQTPSEDVLTEELLAFCRSRLAGYKVPHSVRFVSELPKTGAGKIDKKQLQSQTI